MADELAVAVNLLWCLPGGVGGSEEYLARQLVGLADVAPDVRPELFVPPGYGAAHPELDGLEQVVGPAGGERRVRRVLAEATWLPPRLAGADVVHHGGGTVPPRSPHPVVLTVHDLQWLRHPEYVSAVKLRYLRATVPRSVRRAEVVAVPSEYVRGTVVAATGVDPGRVAVVPHGIDRPADVTDEATVRSRYGIGDRPFVVFPALTHPHKRHHFLLELLAGAVPGSRWADPELTLVLPGGAGLAEVDVVAAVERLGLSGRVVRTGRIPATDRDGLIAAAEALVFPSEYEGFGAPVIEAMVLGTPVVASDRASLPEVAGEAALVRPLDLDAWAGALDEVATRRVELVAAGRARAATYSTAASAAALAVAYRQAGSRPEGSARIGRSRGAKPSLRAEPGPRLRILVLGPHFDPDTAPTGRVLSRIVDELGRRGHELHVVAALPWYRTHAVEPGWSGRLSRTDRTDWGTVRRVHPFPGGDRRNLPRRAAGFAGFSVLAGWAGLGAGGWFRRVDAVIAMSPPLTMGLTGRAVAWAHLAPLVFNIQDVFPDAAVETGAITNPGVIAAARALERASYRVADAVTVLSDDLRANVVGKLPAASADRVHTIPNFVDTNRIRPADRMTPYRAELGIGSEPVVLYAGNIGYSQSLDLVVAAARRLPQATFLVNGDGSARAAIEAAAADVPNVRVAGFVPDDRIVELLATGDVHVVPLRRGLGAVSVPSKTYSILAAGRPVVAAIDPGTEVPRLLAASGAGVAVPPDELTPFVAALAGMIDDPEGAAAMGRAGRDWVTGIASPAAVAAAYEGLITSLAPRRSRPPNGGGRR